MHKTNIVTYPAVFIAEQDDSYTVVFPDVADAVTGGQDLGESLVNATTTLGRFLVHQQADFPQASTMTQLQHRYPTDFVQLVAVDLAKVTPQSLWEHRDEVDVRAFDLTR